MSEFSAKELETALKGDGNLWRDETLDYFGEFYFEADDGEVIDVLGLGEFTVVDTVVGRVGDYDEGTWENYLILQKDDRYFKLPGEYDSWDAQGWGGHVLEVEPVEKTIRVWDKKHDY